MKRFFYAMLAVAATLSFAACNRENDTDTPGTVGSNKLAFTLERVGETRSAAVAPAAVRTGVFSLGEPVEGQALSFEETVVSLDDPTFFSAPETRGTPIYTENFATMSGGKFQALAFPAETMTGKKEWFSTFPRTSYGQTNTDNFADFVQKGDLWEYSYEWDPWFDQETLLFYAKMVVNESTAWTGPELGQNIGVLRNSYEFTYDGTTPKMTFSYRSQLNAEDQQDILFATRPVTKAESRKAVPMIFYHALSGVKFATAHENDGNVKTYIKSVALTGLYGYGKCTITSTAENGEYSDDATIHSSANAVSWDLSSSAANGSLSYVYYQEFPEESVTYSSNGSFTNKGNYPGTFAQAGNKNNLNDGDATMTFWFIPQTLTANTKMTVTFEIEVDGVRKEYTRELSLGDLTHNAEWKAGQLRTFTLKANEVDVKIEDEVHGFIKDNVVITNTGNVEAYIRAHIVANWWGKGDGNDGIALGYKSNEAGTAPLEPIEYVTAWAFETNTTDNYGGVFTGLPGTGWVKAADGYFYYTQIVNPGDPTGTPLFTKYELVTTDHPVPVIWYLSANNGLQKFTEVRLVMDLPVQAIEAPKDDTGAFLDYKTAWAGAGVTVVTE